MNVAKGNLRNEWQNASFKLDAEAPGVQIMVDACEKWCRAFRFHHLHQRAIILSGPFGCGKTSALRSSRRYVHDFRMAAWPNPWPHPPQDIYFDWSEFIQNSSDGQQGVREDVHASDVVFLDDIGSEEDRFKSGAPTRILGDLLGHLHDKGKFVFITTNIHPDGWRERWDGRVEDRLMRMNSSVVNLWLHNAESYAQWRLKQ